jgi:hypothetical protein
LSRIAEFVRETGGALPLALGICGFLVVLEMLLPTCGDGLRDSVALLGVRNGDDAGFASALLDVPDLGRF